MPTTLRPKGKATKIAASLLGAHILAFSLKKKNRNYKKRHYER